MFFLTEASIVREPEIQVWVNLKTPEEKRQYEMTPEILQAIDRFYFSHYCTSFRSGAFARANSSIPMLNCLDDHDLIDGYASYPEALQKSPVFSMIGARGYFFYLLFQCFVVPEHDEVDPKKPHIFKSTIIGGPGVYVQHPSHSSLVSVGPRVSMLLLDCRAERSREQVCSQVEYDIVFERLMTLPSEVEHLVILVGIPIAYPRMNFIE